MHSGLLPVVCITAAIATLPGRRVLLLLLLFILVLAMPVAAVQMPHLERVRKDPHEAHPSIGELTTTVTAPRSAFSSPRQRGALSKAGTRA